MSLASRRVTYRQQRCIDSEVTLTVLFSAASKHPWPLDYALPALIRNSEPGKSACSSRGYDQGLVSVPPINEYRFPLDGFQECPEVYAGGGDGKSLHLSHIDSLTTKVGCGLCPAGRPRAAGPTWGFSHHLHWSGILCHNGICGQQRDSFYRRLSHKETIEWILVDGWQ